MTTGKQALDAALAIMDELGTNEYNARAVFFINMICDQLYPYSDNYVIESEQRPICKRITTLSDTLGIDDVLAQSVLPYGLASRLMLSDDPSQSINFEAIYQERLAEAKRNLPSQFMEIEDVYGFDNGSTINNAW